MADRVIAIRPEPGLSQTIEKSRQEGLDIAGFPLFEIQPVDWNVPEDLTFNGLLIGSANAIRHGGTQLALLLDLPVYAVGKTTADVAAQAGFQIEQVGEGGLQDLVTSLPNRHTRLLRLAGHDHVELLASETVKIVDRIVYRSNLLDASKELAEILRNSPIVMLHSAIAAEHFSNECNRMDIDRQAIRIAAFGPRIADACGTGWDEVRIADEPSDPALLALIKNMCK